MKKGIIIGLSLFLVGSLNATQTGDCTAGTQYCEQNSLGTTNTTTTTNTNTVSYTHLTLPTNREV